jgi:superfamily II DNA/RNA helicase
MPPEIKRLADTFLMNPREVSVSPPASMAETVTHALTVVQPEDKRKALRHLLGTEDVKNALIFCNRKRDVAILHKSLEKHGFNAGALHGDMPQSKRTETLDQFKKGEITLLVCSDVAARGIDIAGLSHVFNFDTPLHAEDYVHRIGRTGRAGKLGRAFTIANPEEGKQVAAISKLIKREIPLISIDGLELADFEEGSDRRRRRSRKDGEEAKAGSNNARLPRGESRAPRPEREARPEREVREVRVEREARPEREVRVEREVRPERESVRPEREAARPDREQRVESMRSDAPPRRDDRRRRRDEDDDDEVVIGFGDHIPAFLLRRARPVATPEA